MKQIVIVEDDPNYSALLSFYLTEKGYKVTSACNGKEGIQKVRELRPDIIVLDVMMPEASGLEVVRTLQSESSLRSIPILVTTGSRFNKSMQDLFEQEGNVRGFLEKTRDLAQIETQIAAVLGNK
ncbi:MAG: response regulator [Elusimicrobia bacterium]|nr:response regulator [Elusimicrobiota bacterium]